MISLIDLYKVGAKMEKKVLSIIYFFPPIGGSGVQRTLKFVKYLPEFDYCPIVETVKNGHNFAYDYSLLDEIPKCVRVYRTDSGETLWLRKIVENAVTVPRKIKALMKPKTVNEISNENANVNNSSSNKDKVSIKDKLFKYIELNHFIPDSKIRWYKHAIKEIDKILNNENIDCIFSSSYPYTVHLIALYAKKKTNLPWIADFRDPWVGNVLMNEGQSEARKNKEADMEREVVKYADRIIMVTEPICEMYKERYPEYKDKFITITNGFDSDDFYKVKAIADNKFTICYSGILTQGRTPETLIKAIEMLVIERPDIKDKIKLKFIGFIIDEYRELINNSTISECIELLEYMPHGECLKHMKGANMNLLILPDNKESRGDFTGKIFDYIGVEKPILGIMPNNGVASNLITNKGIGRSFNHNEVEEVCKYVLENYSKWESGLTNDTDAIKKCIEYDRKELTRQLVSAFNEIV